MSGMNTLLSPGTLGMNHYLRAPNNWFFALMQTDGNFCVYRGTPEKPGGWFWGSQVAPGPGNYFAAMQTDGNFCVYRETPEMPGGWIWGTQAVGGPGSYFAAMQEDGNFCIYPANGPQTALWCSGVHVPVGAEHASKIKVINDRDEPINCEIVFTDGKGSGSSVIPPKLYQHFYFNEQFTQPGLDLYLKSWLTNRADHKSEQNVIFDPKSPDTAVYRVRGGNAFIIDYEGLTR